MTRTPSIPPDRPSSRARIVSRGPGLRAVLLGTLVVVSLGGCANSLRRAQPPRQAPTANLAPARADLAGAVRALADADFAGRARAARTLIAAGVDALPALGRAGAMPVRSAGGVTTSATDAVLEAVLEAVPVDGVEDALGAPWPNVRRASASELGKRDRWGAIPRLIERLDDPAPAVRAASAAALRRLTNNFFGYRALAHLAARRAASDRWRTWWSLEGRARAGQREGPHAEAPRRP